MRMRRERGRPLAARIWSIIIFSDALHQAVLLFWVFARPRKDDGVVSHGEDKKRRLADLTLTCQRIDRSMLQVSGIKNMRTCEKIM